jgi:hypothetical protein
MKSLRQPLALNRIASDLRQLSFHYSLKLCSGENNPAVWIQISLPLRILYARTVFAAF